MTRTFLLRLILIGLASTTAVFANASVAHAAPDQPGEKPAQRPERGPRGERGGGERPVQAIFMAVRDLDLSPEQRQQLRGIAEQARKDFEALRADLESMERRDARAAVDDFVHDVTDKVKSILNDEQKAQFDAKVQEMRRQADEARRKARAEAQGSQAPTTQPGGNDRPGPAGPRGAGPIARFNDALASIEMSPEQRDQVNAIMADARKQFEQLREENQDADPQQLREKARGLIEETRQKLSGVLNGEQMRKLMEAAGPGAGQRERPGGARPDRERPRRGNADGPPPSTQPAAQDNNARTEAAPQGGLSPSGTAAGVGDLLPAFELTRLDGKPFSTRSLAGKPAVIVFGSYSSPTFRDRIGAIDQLAKSYGKRVTFLVIYTREAHPAGEWEPQRNVDDNVQIAQHKTSDDRFAAARTARDRLKLASIEIVPEPMGEAVSKGLDAGSSGAVVVDSKGAIVAKQKFAEAGGLDVHLREALGE